jgi:hypothetical protein
MELLPQPATADHHGIEGVSNECKAGLLAGQRSNADLLGMLIRRQDIEGF